MADAQHHSGAPLWGVAAEFTTADALVAAIAPLRRAGLGRVEAFSPMPLPAAEVAMDVHPRPIAPFAVAGALLGAGAMFGMICYATLISYRFNIGGRPMFSWPLYIVPSVSFGVLVGALSVVAAFLILSRLPRLNHPAFNIRQFTRATEDRFFVAIEARDDRFDPARVDAVLSTLAIQPARVTRVPR